MRMRLMMLTAAAGMFWTGCASMPTPAKVALTPLTVVRDTVDAPLVTLTNVFDYWAERHTKTPVPSAGVGWSWRGGPNFGVGLDLSYYIFKPVSLALGVVDYVPCRSLWPDFPTGISPWRGKDQTWGSLYYPGTRELWRDSGPEPASKTPSASDMGTQVLASR